MTALLYGWFFVAMVLICWRFIANGLSWLYPRYRAWKQLRRNIQDKLHAPPITPEWWIAHNKCLDDCKRNREENKEIVHARQLARLRDEEEARAKQEASMKGTVDQKNAWRENYWPAPVSDDQWMRVWADHGVRCNGKGCTGCDECAK